MLKIPAARVPALNHLSAVHISYTYFSCKTYLKFILHLRLYLQFGLYPLRFLTKALNACLNAVRATYPTHPFLLCSVILKMYIARNTNSDPSKYSVFSTLARYSPYYIPILYCSHALFNNVLGLLTNRNLRITSIFIPYV